MTTYHNQPPVSKTPKFSYSKPHGWNLSLWTTFCKLPWPLFAALGLIISFLFFTSHKWPFETCFDLMFAVYTMLLRVLELRTTWDYIYCNSEIACNRLNLIQPVRSTTQIWVVRHHQYGVSVLISQTSFGGETSSSIGKCRLFSQANSDIAYNRLSSI